MGQSCPSHLDQPHAGPGHRHRGCPISREPIPIRRRALGSPVSKGPFYSQAGPYVSLQSTRDKADHARRHKVWSQGFSTEALDQYNPRVSTAIAKLLQVIDRDHSEAPINVADWFAYFTFDVLEELAFGRNSGMLRRGGDGYVLKTIRRAQGTLALRYHIPWLASIMMRMPILNKRVKAFQEWTWKQLQERARNEPDEPDIFTWVLDAYREGPKTPTDQLRLLGDGQLIILAGSDPVASTLAWLFFELAHNPAYVDRLRKELLALPGLSPEHLEGVELLDALVNETLRLYPPFPSGLQRQTPPEGMSIGDHHIPGNTVVQAPWHTIFRDIRCFSRPNEFVPERRTTQPELIKKKSVFIPFGGGESLLPLSLALALEKGDLQYQTLIRLPRNIRLPRKEAGPVKSPACDS
jgi:cytochrome P450 family 628